MFDIRKVDWYDVFFGNINALFKLRQKLAKPRVDICMTCSSRKMKWLNGGVCAHCGCPVKSKATIKSEHCPEDKW